MAKIGVITAPSHCNGLEGTPVEKQTGAECCNRSRARRVPPISKFRWPPDLVCSRSIYPASKRPTTRHHTVKRQRELCKIAASTSSTCRRLCHFVIEGMGEGGVYASTHVIVYDMCRRPPSRRRPPSDMRFAPAFSHVFSAFPRW